MPKKTKDKKPKKSRKRKPKSRSDRDSGVTWETYFVRGKQKRRKVVPHFDTDGWLLDNADDIYLHQTGRHDLLLRREQEGGDSTGSAPLVKLIPMRHVPMVFSEVQRAVEAAPDEEFFLAPEIDETFRRAYIEIATGDIVWSEDYYDDRFAGAEFLCVDEPIIYRPRYGDLDDFISRLEDMRLVKQLKNTVGRRRKGAFRRFETVVCCGKHKGLERAWKSYSERRQREWITEWLNAHRIEPEWVWDIEEHPGDICSQ